MITGWEADAANTDKRFSKYMDVFPGSKDFVLLRGGKKTHPGVKGVNILLLLSNQSNTPAKKSNFSGDGRFISNGFWDIQHAGRQVLSSQMPPMSQRIHLHYRWLREQLELLPPGTQKVRVEEEKNNRIKVRLASSCSFRKRLSMAPRRLKCQLVLPGIGRQLLAWTDTE